MRLLLLALIVISPLLRAEMATVPAGLLRYLGQPLGSGTGAKEFQFKSLVNSYSAPTVYARVVDENKIQFMGIQNEMLIHVLSEFITEEQNTKLQDKFKGQMYLSKADLKSHGIDAEYKEECTCIDFKVPYEWLSPSRLYFNNRNLDFKDAKQPDPVSGILNLYALKRMSQTSAAGPTDEDILTAQVSTSIEGVNFFSGANYYGRDNEVDRSETGVVIPMDKGDKQVWLGDISYLDNAGLQHPTNVSGLGFFKRSNQNQNRNKVNQMSFYLKNPSTVTVYNNERMITTHDFDPGQFILSDLALEQGVNNVRIVIKDNVTGEIIEKIITDYIDFSNTPRGEFEYTLLQGQTRDKGSREIRYVDPPLTYLGGSYGFTNSLSTSGDILNQDEYSRFRLQERVFISNLNFSGGIGHSLNGTDNLSGNTLFTTLSGIKSSKIRLSQLTLGYQYMGAGYGESRGSEDLSARQSYRAVATFGPFYQANVSLGHSRVFSERINDEDYFLSATQRYRISKHWDLLFSGGEFLSTKTSDEFRFSIFLNYNEKYGDSNVSGATRITEKSRSASASYSEPNDYSISANYGDGDGYQSYGLKAKKTFSRAELEADQTISRGESKASTTTLRAGTALAFTNKTWTISKPVQDSFVIFDVKDRSAAYDLNDKAGHKIGESDRLIKSVLVPASSYSVTPITPGFADPKFATLDSSELIAFGSGFKTGSSYVLSPNSEILANAILVDETGERLANKTVQLICTSTSKPKKILSDSSGKIEFLAQRMDECTIQVDEKKSEILDLAWPMKFKDFDKIEVKGASP